MSHIWLYTPDYKVSEQPCHHHKHLLTASDHNMLGSSAAVIMAPSFLCNEEGEVLHPLARLQCWLGPPTQPN